MDRSLGGPQSRSGHADREKIRVPTGNRAAGRSARSPSFKRVIVAVEMGYDTSESARPISL